MTFFFIRLLALGVYFVLYIRKLKDSGNREYVSLNAEAGTYRIPVVQDSKYFSSISTYKTSEASPPNVFSEFFSANAARAFYQ